VPKPVRCAAVLEQRLEVPDCVGTLQREHRVVGRAVANLDAVPALGLLGEPCEVRLGVRRVHDGEEAAVLQPVREQVIEHTAVLAAQQRVLSAAQADLVEVVAQQVAQELRRPWPSRLDLAHVRNVEETGARAHRHVLLANALVLHRHLPAGERNQPRARFGVQLEKRGPLELGGGCGQR
jgi:hypothetical protein